VPQGDPNTETTAYAVLALNARPQPCLHKVYLPLPAARCSARAAGDPIQRGVAFLKCQYNPSVGLLQESPTIHWNRYYLANSNALAAYTLETLGVAPKLATALRNGLGRYPDHDHNGFIEVAWGETIRWPPYHHQDRLLEQIGQACILYEAHDGPGYFYDWSAYSNLVFMAVLNEYNQGYLESARRLFAIEMSTFDGYGFPDLAYDKRGGIYETIGPAWALYAAARLDIPPDDEQVNALRRILLEQQDPVSGGFHTHYRPAEPRLADPNVETTCLALLALHADRQ